MIGYTIAILLIPLAYAFGCFSSAHIVAKAWKSLNIFKIGTGLADTENIYYQVGKAPGMLVGFIDVAKMYLFMEILKTILLYFFHTKGAVYPWLLVYGALALIGHSLPVTNHFRGGRGVLTYSGLMFYLAPLPMLIASVFSLTFFFGFKQLRFSQYNIVALPAVLALLSNRFFHTNYPGFVTFFVYILLMMILNIILSRRLGEF